LLSMLRRRGPPLRGRRGGGHEIRLLSRPDDGAILADVDRELAVVRPPGARFDSDARRGPRRSARPESADIRSPATRNDKEQATTVIDQIRTRHSGAARPATRRGRQAPPRARRARPARQIFARSRPPREQAPIGEQTGFHGGDWEGRPEPSRWSHENVEPGPRRSLSRRRRKCLSASEGRSGRPAIAGMRGQAAHPGSPGHPPTEI
jgi:hypothetical protein